MKGVTGNRVLPGAKSHTTQIANIILAWFEALNARALNTFNSAPASTSVPEDLRTCGARRVLRKRAQIDFMAVAPRVS
eukprot:2445763-Pyramimonas_sp.AAC.1